MHLFKSEREETHQLFMENDGSIKQLIAAFESLRVQVKADQQEMQRVKEGLLQYEELKEKYQQENIMKDEEIVMLQTKLADKETELQNVLCDLDKSQKYCKQLQESTTAALEQSKKEYEQIILSKDISMQELNRVKNQQKEKLEKIETAMEELKSSLNLEMQRVKDLKEKLMASNNELEQRTAILGETMEQAARKDDMIKILEDELNTKSKFIEYLKSKTDILEARVEELDAEISRKTEEIQMFKSEAQLAWAEKDKLKQTCEDADKATKELMEKFTITEIKVLELEGKLSAEMKKNEDYASKLEHLKKDITQHERKYEELLSNFNKLQSEKLAIQQEFENGLSNVKAIEADRKASEEKAVKLEREIQSLEGQNQCLRNEVNTIKMSIQGKCQETETLQKKMEEHCEHLQEKITGKEKHIKAVEAKMGNLKKKIEIKFKIQEEYKRENKLLKKQIEKETTKSSELEMMVDNLQEESQNLRKIRDKDHQKLLKDFESKSTLAVELENEIQKLRLTAAEAIKNKEDTELKCQHKITDMVALMEKHKSQYDKMVEEKDAELEENKKKEVEAVAHANSLELELLKQKTENNQLKSQAKAEAAEKENLQTKLTNLVKELSTVKNTQPSQGRSKPSAAQNDKQGRVPDSPEESSSKRSVFDFSKSRKTPSYYNYRSTEVFNKAHILNEDVKTPGSHSSRFGAASKIKSYRIRTPPTDENAARLGKSTIEFDPKSDSSDNFDLLTLANVPAPSVSAAQCKVNIFKKLQSPAALKSPGNSLKLAAIKRMRDAGWTAVTGCDKKKKKTNEKIFA
ncbi:synaptonemal complex protein 1 isoform X2 [Melanotaenia boesemani]|nr:synaptonemal complex protein 1 isoform X2 [Melanotaenia boesemani]